MLCEIVKPSSQENRQHFLVKLRQERGGECGGHKFAKKNHTPSRVKSIWLVSDCLFPNDFISGFVTA